MTGTLESGTALGLSECEAEAASQAARLYLILERDEVFVKRKLIHRLFDTPHEFRGPFIANGCSLSSGRETIKRWWFGYLVDLDVLDRLVITITASVGDPPVDPERERRRRWFRR